MSFIRRLLNRRKPLICRLCGFEVPVIGSRWDQANLAIDHMEDEHHDYYHYGAPNEIGDES